jgi:hypothetical protein
MKKVVEVETSRLTELRAEKRVLDEFKTIAVGMEDEVIKTIEDEAEKCIEQILQNKEALKKKAKDHFGVVGELNTHQETLPGLITKLEETVTGARTLLAEVVLHPKYLEKLMKLKNQIDGLKQPQYIQNRDSYRSKFTTLRNKGVKFYPGGRNLMFGDIRITGQKMKLYCNHCGITNEIYVEQQLFPAKKRTPKTQNYPCVHCNFQLSYKY